MLSGQSLFFFFQSGVTLVNIMALTRYEKLVDGIFWPILFILLLTAIGTIIAGVSLSRAGSTAVGGWTIALGSLAVFVSIAAAIAHGVLTWKRGNWIKSVKNAITGIPARVQDKYDRRVQRLKEQKSRERMRKAIVRCRAGTGRKGDELICEVVDAAARQNVSIANIDDFDKFRANNADQAVDQTIEQVIEQINKEAEKEAEREVGPIQAFAKGYSKAPTPATLPTPQSSAGSLSADVQYSSLPADARSPWYGQGAVRPSMLPPPPQ